jgi:hypothetical protein
MSYDVAVFEPTISLRDRSAFLHWFELRTQWGPSATDSGNSTPRLRSWFDEMIKTFPSMSTQDRPPMDDADAWERAVDYSFAGDMIYVAISGERAEMGYELISRLAAKFGVGIYDVSDAGDVWFPTLDGGLEVVHTGL